MLQYLFLPLKVSPWIAARHTGVGDRFAIEFLFAVVLQSQIIKRIAPLTTRCSSRLDFAFNLPASQR